MLVHIASFPQHTFRKDSREYILTPDDTVVQDGRTIATVIRGKLIVHNGATFSQDECAIFTRASRYYRSARKYYPCFAWATMFEDVVPIRVGTSFHTDEYCRIQAIRYRDGHAVLVDFEDADGCAIDLDCASIRIVHKISDSEDIGQVFDNHCSVFSQDCIEIVPGTRTELWKSDNRKANFEKLHPFFKFWYNAHMLHAKLYDMPNRGINLRTLVVQLDNAYMDRADELEVAVELAQSEHECTILAAVHSRDA